MPTFPKLLAGFLFAGLAYYASGIVVEMFVEERPLLYLEYWNAGFGFAIAWRIVGNRAGTGLSAAIGYAITTTLAIWIATVFIHSSAEMIRRAMRLQYDGPAEAVISVLQIAYDYAFRVATPEMLGLTFGGGLVAAIIVEFMARRTT